MRLLLAASRTDGHDLPEALTGLLTRLVAHATDGSDRARSMGRAALRDVLEQIADHWMPERRSRDSSRPRRQPRPFDPQDHGEAQHLLTICLEVGVAAEALAEAVDHMAATRQVGLLLDLLQAATPSAASATVWRRILRPETVRYILEDQPVDLRSLDRLLPHLRGQALDAVFDCLATSENRAIRRSLLDRLAGLGVETARLAVRRLHDDRWFVVRNMLMLLAEVGETPPEFSALGFLRHHDPRVRFEALRVALRRPEEVRAALTEVLLGDRDRRVIWLALTSLRSTCPAWAIDPLYSLVTDESIDADLRSLAVRALGACTDPAALHVLLNLADPDRTDARGPRDRRNDEALRSLAATWADDPRVRAVLTRFASRLPARLRAGKLVDA
jgi:HEAT repeat protein